MNEFGRKLKMRREQRGMTQDELAAKAGLSQSTISRFETGQQTPSLQEANILARVLKFTIMLGYKKKENSNDPDEK